MESCEWCLLGVSIQRLGTESNSMRDEPSRMTERQEREEKGKESKGLAKRGAWEGGDLKMVVHGGRGAVLGRAGESWWLSPHCLSLAMVEGYVVA